MISYFAPIPAVIEAIKAGQMVILVDDEDRENEGDLVIAAEKATPEAVNFMAKYGRGLICLSLTRERVATLQLPLMAQHNQSRHQTAFTVSIEAREGISTGISAADRAKTIRDAIDPSKDYRHIVSPGHIFPLVARDGGVLVRAGHTEASVDLARLAGLNPAGVICEIMKDDGTMARLPDLIPFAKEHGLLIACIADLIRYRRQHEVFVTKLKTHPYTHPSTGQAMQVTVYRNTLSGVEHLAFIKGTPSPEQPTLVRMHALKLYHDIFTDQDQLIHRGLRRIADAECGVFVLLNDPTMHALSEHMLGAQEAAPALRDYGIGAQILKECGVRAMRLLTTAKKTVVGLDGFGLHITGFETLG